MRNIVHKSFLLFLSLSSFSLSYPPHNLHIFLRINTTFIIYTKVTHLFSTTVADTILCGGQFCDAEGTEFALSGFDTNQLVTFTAKEQKDAMAIGGKTPSQTATNTTTK